VLNEVSDGKVHGGSPLDKRSRGEFSDRLRKKMYQRRERKRVAYVPECQKRERERVASVPTIHKDNK
jgi:hypothetical protein